MRMLAHCLMPNHFHMVVWPGEDGHLSTLMQRDTTARVQRCPHHYTRRPYNPSLLHFILFLSFFAYSQTLTPPESNSDSTPRLYFPFTPSTP